MPWSWGVAAPAPASQVGDPGAVRPSR